MLCAVVVAVFPIISSTSVRVAQRGPRASGPVPHGAARRACRRSACASRARCPTSSRDCASPAAAWPSSARWSREFVAGPAARGAGPPTRSSRRHPFNVPRLFAAPVLITPPRRHRAVPDRRLRVAHRSRAVARKRTRGNLLRDPVLHNHPSCRPRFPHATLRAHAQSARDQPGRAKSLPAKLRTVLFLVDPAKDPGSSARSRSWGRWPPRWPSLRKAGTSRRSGAFNARRSRAVAAVDRGSARAVPRGQGVHERDHRGRARHPRVHVHALKLEKCATAADLATLLFDYAQALLKNSTREAVRAMVEHARELLAAGAKPQ